MTAWVNAIIGALQGCGETSCAAACGDNIEFVESGFLCEDPARPHASGESPTRMRQRGGKPAFVYQESALEFPSSSPEDRRAMATASSADAMEERPQTLCKGGVRYTGQWRGNLRHGEGRLERPDGGRYEGQFRNDQAYGNGRFIAANGNVYDGQWIEDSAQGHGKYTRSDGETYEGEWERDEKSGRGVECFADGSRYEGAYHRGKRHGHGSYTSANGMHYEGQFVRDKMDGDGTHTFKDGRKYTGQWENGRMSGFGRMTYASGACYEGGYECDAKNGDGIFTWPDGRTYKGQWRDGQQHGTGVATDREGKSLTAEWREGQRVGDSRKGKGKGMRRPSPRTQNTRAASQERAEPLSAKSRGPRPFHAADDGGDAPQAKGVGDSDGIAERLPDVAPFGPKARAGAFGPCKGGA